MKNLVSYWAALALLSATAVWAGGDCCSKDQAAGGCDKAKSSDQAKAQCPADKTTSGDKTTGADKSDSQGQLAKSDKTTQK
jgi:hypothetical protein